MTALMFAAESNENADVIERLVTLGADVNTRDEDGKTALAYAVEEGIYSTNQVERLLGLGADVTRDIVSSASGNSLKDTKLFWRLNDALYKN